MSIILLTLPISRSPLTGLNRSMDIIGLNIGEDDVTLRQKIYSLDSNNNRVTSPQAPPYQIDSATGPIDMVDPATGIYVAQNGVDGNGNPTYVYNGGPNNGQAFTGTAVLEFAFLMALLGQTVNILALITAKVGLNDSLGKYN